SDPDARQTRPQPVQGVFAATSSMGRSAPQPAYEQATKSPFGTMNTGRPSSEYNRGSGPGSSTGARRRQRGRSPCRRLAGAMGPVLEATGPPGDTAAEGDVGSGATTLTSPAHSATGRDRHPRKVSSASCASGGRCVVSDPGGPAGGVMPCARPPPSGGVSRVVRRRVLSVLAAAAVSINPD